MTQITTSHHTRTPAQCQCANQLLAAVEWLPGGECIIEMMKITSPGNYDNERPISC